MQNNFDMHILFATSFSDACFRAGRAIGQLADKLRVRLTIAHVAAPGAATIQTRRELDSFIAEADHYDYCRRVLLESTSPAEALGDLCDSTGVDLVMAPCSDRLRLFRFTRSSFRARLIQHCNAPLWTAGICLDKSPSRPFMQTIACLIDFDSPSDNHLRLAASLARRIGAGLRLLTVVEPVTEATLARSIDSSAPLMPDVARNKLQAIFGRECPPVEVAVGRVETEVPRLLNQCDADLLFVGRGHVLGGVWRPYLTRWLDGLRCPAICVDGAAASFEGWHLHSADATVNPEFAKKALAG